MISFLIRLAEKGFLPDFFIKIGIKQLSKVRLDFAKNSSPEEIEKRHDDWVKDMKNSPIALVPEKANEQHYEVPPEFFELRFQVLLTLDINAVLPKIATPVALPPRVSSAKTIAKVEPAT